MTISRLIYFSLVCAAATFASCSSEDSGERVPQSMNVNNSFINLAITVDNAKVNETRALPAAGENGDGREAAFERENNIEGVTLILYRDTAGINTTNADKDTLELVRYFLVTLENRDDQGTQYSSKTDEAYYTTGDQPLGDTQLDFNEKYHAIVIANRRTDLVEGVSTLQDVRDMATSTVYTGAYNAMPSAITDFIITSESDDTINFSKITPTTDDDNNRHYDLTKQPIRIERMAARIDFWTSKATLNANDKNGKAYDGYVYPVWKETDTDAKPTSEDRFVVRYVIPFNLNDGDEYMLKRFDGGKWLVDEDGTNAVIDPETSNKTATSAPASFENTLDDLLEQVKEDTEKSNIYARELSKLYDDIDNGSGTKDFTDDGKTGDNLIIAYPKENTLVKEAPLYYNATGLMIVGYYYSGDDVTVEPTKYVYFTYLRHQGESETSYLPYRYDYKSDTGVADIDVAKDALNSKTDAMNFGVVRNNIYRVNITRVNEQGDVTLTIKVKKWDPYTHSVIYM